MDNNRISMNKIKKVIVITAVLLFILSLPIYYLHHLRNQESSSDKLFEYIGPISSYTINTSLLDIPFNNTSTMGFFAQDIFEDEWGHIYISILDQNNSIWIATNPIDNWTSPFIFILYQPPTRLDFNRSFFGLLSNGTPYVRVVYGNQSKDWILIQWPEKWNACLNPLNIPVTYPFFNITELPIRPVLEPWTVTSLNNTLVFVGGFIGQTLETAVTFNSPSFLLKKENNGWSHVYVISRNGDASVMKFIVHGVNTNMIIILECFADHWTIYSPISLNRK